MRKAERTTRWSKILDIVRLEQEETQLDTQNENMKLSHPDQAQIHSDCSNLYKVIPIFDEPDLKHTLEFGITFYCMSENLHYVSGMHMTFAPFLLMGFHSLKTVYVTFKAFINTAMPRVFRKSSSIPFASEVFKKLLMYFDPILCNLLEAQMNSIETYTEKWFVCLLASALDTPLLLALWEYSIKEKNLTLPYFFAVAMLRKERYAIINGQLPNIYITDANMLDELNQDALAMQREIPTSFIDLMIELLVMPAKPSMQAKIALQQCTVLPVAAYIAANPHTNYFTIDMQTQAEYAEANFPQSFNLNVNISTEEIWTILNGFNLHYQKKTGKCWNFLFVGSSTPTEQMKLSTLCLDLVRRGVSRVGMISGKPSGKPNDAKSEMRCEVSNIIRITAQNSASARDRRILAAMWNAYSQEEGEAEDTGRQSTAEAKIATELVSNKQIYMSMWKDSFQESERYYDERKDTDPRYALHYAESNFMKVLLLGDKHTRADALEKLDYAEAIAKQFNEKYEDAGSRILNAKNVKSVSGAIDLVKTSQRARVGLVTLAEVLLYKASSELIQKHYVNGSIMLRKSWKLYKKWEQLTVAQKAMEKTFYEDMRSAIDTEIEDDLLQFQNFGLGIFYLTLSMVPENILLVAKIAAGMEADQTKGLKLLYDCINANQSVRLPFSLLFILFWLLIYIPDFIPGRDERLREAEELIKVGLHVFKGSTFFYWLKSYMDMKQADLDHASRMLDRAIRASKSLISHSPRLAFEKSWVYFLKQNWSQSLSYIEAANANEPTPFMMLITGVLYCMVGAFEQAEEWFNRISSMDITNTLEKWISRRAKRLLHRKWFQLFPYEIIYVTDWFQCISGEYIELAYSNICDIDMEIPQEPKKQSFFSLSRNVQEDSDEYVIMLLYKGVIQRLMGRLKEAVVTLETGLKYQLAVNVDTFTIPHIYYELSLIYMKGRDWDEASEAMNKAKKFKKKYDFRRSLNFKLNASRELMQKECGSETKRHRKEF